MGLKIFNSKLSTLTKDFDLRVDSKFYELIKDNDFVFIKNKKYPLIELRHILEPYYEEVVFVDDKKYRGLVTSAEFFDEEGHILDYLEITKENHPKRIRFNVKPNNIVISSLKGAIVKTMLINEEKANYVWSDGFYIFNKINDAFENDYIFYILKSKKLRDILDERLSRGIGISAFYERDLLRLKIPQVPKTIQQIALKQIAEIEDKISEVKETIPEVQELIEKTIEEGLSISSFKELSNSKTKVFIKKFSDIGRKLNLRCDPKYIIFWDTTHGSIFRYKGRQIPLRKILEVERPVILKKGLLKKKMILINKEDVEPKTGVIINEDFVDKIESDKIVFGDADLLISKIDPFLGHVILNKKGKEFIGTTEFMSLKFKRNDNQDFIKFLLLSDAYLQITRYVLSGKRQPRINYYDLLSLKIPDISETEQKITSDRINVNIGDLKDKNNTLKTYREEIERILLISLSA